MRKALKKDKKRSVEILLTSFKKNPSVLWVVKNDSRIDKRIVELCKYSFKTALMREGAFISSDNNGVALCYKYNFKKESFTDYWNQFLLAIKAIGLSRVVTVLKREAYTKSKRPAKGEFLYFWFLGVAPGKQNGVAARELRNGIFKKANEQKLPIYLETSVEKNKNVYQRFGFEVYHTWNVKEKNINLYFMRRMPV